MKGFPFRSKGFGINHKIIILKESSPSITVIKKPNNLGKSTSCEKKKHITPDTPYL